MKPIHEVVTMGTPADKPGCKLDTKVTTPDLAEGKMILLRLLV